MVYCGSGLFQVAFSSVAIFSAIYSHFLLKTYITKLQWLGILVVTLGLCISPLSGNTVSDFPYTGILLTLLGAQFYALSYIVNELILVLLQIVSHLQRIPGNKGSKEICKNVGLLNTFVCLLVILLDTSFFFFLFFFSVPHREELVFTPLRARHATLQVVFHALSQLGSTCVDGGVYRIAYTAFIRFVLCTGSFGSHLDRVTTMHPGMCGVHCF